MAYEFDRDFDKFDLQFSILNLTLDQNDFCSLI